MKAFLEKSPPNKSAGAVQAIRFLQCCHRWLLIAKVAFFDRSWRDVFSASPPPPLHWKVAIFSLTHSLLNTIHFVAISYPQNTPFSKNFAGFRRHSNFTTKNFCSRQFFYISTYLKQLAYTSALPRVQFWCIFLANRRLLGRFITLKPNFRHLTPGGRHKHLGTATLRVQTIKLYSKFTSSIIINCFCCVQNYNFWPF